MFLVKRLFDLYFMYGIFCINKPRYLVQFNFLIKIIISMNNEKVNFFFFKDFYLDLYRNLEYCQFQ